MTRIAGIPNKKSIYERFREKYMIDENGCWITSTNARFYVSREAGYAQISHFAWYLKHGHLPAKELYSTCKNKRCINPSHKIISNPVDIFWSSVKKTETCWVWNGNRDVKGYGRINFLEFPEFSKAHRFSWFLSNGEIPPGLLVCHKCDNPSCVNPEHLFLGTIKDNNLDKERKGRHRGARGERNFGAVLGEAQVEAIRFLYSSGKFSTYKLSDVFQVSRNCISKIVNEKTWRHV